MSEQHPNPYYEELAHLVIAKPSVALKKGEVCFYEGKAQSYKTVTKIKKKPRKKTSFIITPWFALWGRKTYVETEKEDVTEQLKATDQMEWVRKMNNIHAQATKIVNAELVFV